MKRTIFSLLAVLSVIATANADNSSTTNAVVSAKANAIPTKLPEVTVRERKDDPTAYHVPDAVAATKTDTPIMQTPVSVQVIPQQVLQDQQILRLDDAIQNVSGVIPNNDSYGTADSFTIRGFDQNEVTYEDGIKVDQYTTSGFSRDLANIEQVEVVKGPASVLYGRAEPGGLVDIVTKKPLETPYYSFEQQIGSYDLYRSTLDATGPLNTNKTWLYRFNASYENAGSFRDFVHSDRVFLFPTIQWKPDANNQITAEFKYGHGTDTIDNGIPFLTNGTPANVPISRNYAEPNANRATGEEYAIKLSASHDFNDDWKLRLVYKTEYHDEPSPNIVDYAGDAGADGIPGDLQRYWFTETFFHHWTHQVVLDLTGKFETFGIKHTAIAGFDYYHQEGEYDYGGSTNSPPSINIYNPVYGQPFPPQDSASAGINKSGQDAYGAYLQDQMELPGHVFVLAGFRYDQATTYENYYDIHGNLNFPTSTHDTPAPTPRAGILWQAVPQLSLYATYTENFGATPLGSPTQPGVILPAESAQQYEFGVKTEFFEKRLSATASIYQLTKQNIPEPGPNNTTITIGEARSRGVELDIAGKITPGWSVIAGYSYIDCDVTKDLTGLEGLRCPGIPYNSGSLWTTYEIQHGPLKRLKFGAGVVYRDSEVAYEYGSNFPDRIPSYAIVNAMASYEWHIGKTKLSAQLNVNNLLDKTYFSSVNPYQAMPGEPLNLLGSLRLEF